MLLKALIVRSTTQKDVLFPRTPDVSRRLGDVSLSSAWNGQHDSTTIEGT